MGNTSSVIDGETVSRAQSVASDTAKVSKKIHNSKFLIDNFAKFIFNLPNNDDLSSVNFAKQVVLGLGLNPSQDEHSEYVHLLSDKGDTYTLRISDHNGNARNILLKGVKTDKGYSIVLHTPLSPNMKFKSERWANVNEYVYKNPTRERLVGISKSIFGLLDSGEYVDIAHADEHNISPRENISEHRVTEDLQTFHSVAVTDQMKQDVMQGQPMFFRSGEHQAYGFVYNGTIYIDPRIATA